METAKAFLWGPVKQALINDLREHGPDMVCRLCYTDQQRVKEMMVAVLTDYGQDNLPAVEGICRQILPPTSARSSAARIRQLLRPPAVDSDRQQRSARQIVVETAARLSLAWPVFAGALHPDPGTRTVAVRSLYHLWERNPRLGFDILDELAGRIMPSVVPDPAAFEAAMGISAIIFFDHTHDREVLQRLQGIWHKIINDILRIHESSGRVGRLVGDLIREQVLGVAFTLLVRLLRELPAYNPFNYPNLEAFFRKDSDEMALYWRLIQYVDTTGLYTREQLEADCLLALGTRNILIQSVLVLILDLHGLKEGERFLPFLEMLFQTAHADPIPSPYLSAIAIVPMFILQRDPSLNAMFDFLVHCSAVCQDYYASHPVIPGYTLITLSPEATMLSAYILLQYIRSGTTHTAWLESRIQQALIRQDHAFFNALVNQELVIVGYELHNPQAALDALTLFFPSQQPEIDQLVQPFLTRLRLLYPDLIDDFLEEVGAPAEVRVYVQTNESVETIGEMIGTRVYHFVLQMLEESPQLRVQCMQLLADAANCRNTREWFSRIIRQMVNWVYGDEVLRQL